MPFKKRARKISEYALSEASKRRMLQKELDDEQAVEPSRLASDGQTLQHRPTYRSSLRQLQESFSVNRDEKTIIAIIKLVFGFEPRMKQLEAIMCVLRGNDLIFWRRPPSVKVLFHNLFPLFYRDP